VVTQFAVGTSSKRKEKPPQNGAAIYQPVNCLPAETPEADHRPVSVVSCCVAVLPPELLPDALAPREQSTF
jgi:hypothetical protein